MADKMTFMNKWITDIVNDDNLEVTEQELAYITYAAVMYGLEGKKINIGETFGKEFKGLNMAMPNIYGQIDNIKNYAEKVGGNVKVKYDSNAIKELRLKGLTAVEICEELGYDKDKAKSLTSNKGWVEAGKELRQKSTESVQKVQNFSF